MSSVKPIYEFLLWDNCSNNCQFCFQRKSPRLFSSLQQQAIASEVLRFLSSSQYEEGSHILLVGGEIFDDISRFSWLSSFFDEIIQMQSENKIDQLYLNTNLIYSKECLQNVIYVLKKFEEAKLCKRLHFTTSYDTNGRFKSKECEQKFLSNLDDVVTSCNAVTPIVNSILTKDFCKKTLSGEFDVATFRNQHRVDFNLIPYIVLDPQLQAPRDLLFKTLAHIRNADQAFFSKQLAEYDLKQKRKMYYFQEKWISCECQLAECGHSVNFQRYSNNGSCFVCDVRKLFGYV